MTVLFRKRESRRGRLQRLLADVLAVEHAGEADLLDGRVGLLAGVRQVVADRRHRQHPAAVGEDAVAIESRASVEHLYVGQARDRVEAGDDLALLERPRIAAACEHDADRGPWIPVKPLADEFGEL